MTNFFGKLALVALIVFLLVVFVPLVLVFITAIVFLVAVVLIIVSCTGVPIEIKEDGKIIGHIVRFKFVPKTIDNDDKA